MATAIDLTAPGLGLVEKRGGISQWPRHVLQFGRRKPLGAVGGLIIVAMLFSAIFVDTAIIGGSTPLLAPDGYNDQVFGGENLGSSWSHPLGTDQAGRDLFSRILYGARVSIVIGLITVSFVGFFSLIVGTVSGYFGGWIDTVMQRLVDVLLAIPGIVSLLFGLSVFAPRAGPYRTMSWIVVILVILITAANARVVRGAALSIAANQYVDAARTIGATNTRIILQHIVPNAVPVVIVLATLQLGTVILLEASISFLGYGVRDPFPSWGAMLNISGSSQFRAHPEQAIWPGLAIFSAVYGFNMLGDALRDVLDPRLRGGR